MALTSLAYLSAEQLRAFADAKPFRIATFAELLRNDSRMFYCPTCDQMVTLLHPIAGFREKPWRTDVFKWREA